MEGGHSHHGPDRTLFGWRMAVEDMPKMTISVDMKIWNWGLWDTESLRCYELFEMLSFCPRSLFLCRMDSAFASVNITVPVFSQCIF